MARVKGLFAGLKRRWQAAGLAAACAVAFFSCDMGFDQNTFQNKVGEYFLEMTSTAAVGDYLISPGDIMTDNAGATCVPSSNDHTVTFYLRNPQKYNFTLGSNMTLQIGAFTEYPPSQISIAQDASDTSKIVITYSAEFLRDNGEGTDISPHVTLFHPVSRNNFGTYERLNLSSNSPPPSPSGAVVAQTNESTLSKWVVCFNLPKADVMKPIHKDLASVAINGKTCGASVDGGGNISFSADQISISRSAPSVGIAANQVTGLSFDAPAGGEQAAYFVTDDQVSDQEKVYSITVTDSAGLSSSVTVSARGFKLSAPDAFRIGETEQLTTGGAVKNLLNQEDDGSARASLRAQAKTIPSPDPENPGETKQYDYDASNAYIVYEFYSDSALANMIGSGRISGVNGNLTMPAIDCWVKAFVRKPLYADSDPVVWRFHSVCTNFYVSNMGVAGNIGSKAAPLDTIQHAIDKLDAGFAAGDYSVSTPLAIYVMSDINLYGPGATWNGGSMMPALTISGYGGTRTIDYGNAATAAALTVTAGTVVVNNIKFANCNKNALVISAGSVTCNSCAFVDCSSDGAGGAVNNSGVFEAKSCVFERCLALGGCDGGAICQNPSGNTKLYSSTIKGCKAEKGSAIFSNGTLLIYASTITGNTTENAESGAVHYAGSVTGFSILEGTTRILGNHNSGAGKDIDVYLPFGKLINTEQDLANSRIGVYMPFTTGEGGNAPTPDKRVLFTNGYQNCNSKKPGEIFVSNNGYGIAIGKTEAGLQEASFAVSGGGMYTAFDYTISFAAADASVKGMYPGADFTYAIKPTIKRTEKTTPASTRTLILNPANNKLYTSDGFDDEFDLAGDEAVLLSAQLYAGSDLAADNLVCTVNSSDKISVKIPAQSYVDTYTLKITASYLGREHTGSFNLVCDRSADNAAAYIMGLTTSPSKPVVVEGLVGPEATDGLAKVADAIRTHGNADGSVAFDNVRISLDARGTSPIGTTLEALAQYNDGEYFKGCLALTAIQLPDWMLDVVDHLFEGCSNLASATLSPNTQYIGVNAFKGCSALASITLPASVTEIAAGAFVGCASGFKITYQGTVEQWSNVKRSSGAWHDGAIEESDSDGSVTCSGGSKCGFDYKIIGLDTPLTIEALGNVTVTFNNKAIGTVTYMVNGGTPQTINGSSTAEISLSAHQKVEFYGNNTKYSGGYDPVIACDSPCYVYGNIMSLVNAANFATNVTLTENNAFAGFFLDNVNIRNKEGAKLFLPATTITENCYYEMFAGCTGLTTAPDLPALTMERLCYSYMFYGCASLTSAPDLPATALASLCYESMFSECTSLTNAPEISARTLAYACCRYMFSGCISLTASPRLYADELVVNCYESMFDDCTRLTDIYCYATKLKPDMVPEGMSTTFGNSVGSWLDGASSTGTIHVKNATLGDWNGSTNWTVVNDLN